MRRRDRRVWLADILDACRALAAHVDGMSFDEYAKDRKTRSAVEREFITIGEAMGRLLQDDPSLEPRFTEARAIIGFRNVLVHGYAELNDRRVWSTAKESIPLLIVEAAAMLEDAGE